MLNLARPLEASWLSKRSISILKAAISSIYLSAGQPRRSWQKVFSSPEHIVSNIKVERGNVNKVYPKLDLQ